MSKHNNECKFPKSGDKRDCRCEIDKYKVPVLITFGVLVFQLLVLWWTNNLALRADTFHVSSDLFVFVGALLIGYVCLIISDPTENLIRNVFAVIGILLLVGGGFHVILEANERLINPADIECWPVIITGIVGGYANYRVHKRLEGADKNDQDNIHKTVSTHALSDMACSAAVAISATVILITGWLRADPFMSIGIACYIFFLSGRLVYKLIDREKRYRLVAVIMTIPALTIIIFAWSMINIFALTSIIALLLFSAGFLFGSKPDECCAH